MKKMNLFLSIMTLCSLFTFSGCKGTSNSTQGVPTSSSIVAANKVEYKFTVKSIAGDRIGDVTIEIYKNEQLITEVQTDMIGNAKIELPEDNYTVMVSGLTKGYVFEEAISIRAGQNLIEVAASIIKEDMPEDHEYKLNDVMYDFTVYDLENNSLTLSEVLETKKGVLINFWATWCGPCKAEFPHFVDAYAEYADEFEIIALVVDDEFGSPDKTIKELMLDYGVEFFVGRDVNLQVFMPFYQFFKGYEPGTFTIPGSILIDQYGIIYGIKSGAFSSYNELANSIEDIITKYE